MSRLRRCWVGVQSPQCDRSCSLSRRPCRGRTLRCGQRPRMAPPTEAAAPPAPGTPCPGTWARRSGAGAAEAARQAMAASWTQLSGQSSESQVSEGPRPPASKRWLVALAARSAALRAGVGAGRTGEARGSERPCPRDCRQHSATYWPHRSLHRRHHRPHDPAQRPSALRILSWVPGAELPAGPWSWLPPRGAVEARPQDRRVPPCARAWPFWGEDGKAG